MTAHDLVIALTAAGCSPDIEGQDLVLDVDPPANLEPMIELLQTGVRSILTGRRWFGSNALGRGCGPGLDGALNPNAKLPAGTVRLTVEGDPHWDRIAPNAHKEWPEAFEELASRRRVIR